MSQSVEQLMLSVERIVHLFSQIDAQLDVGDYAIAQVMVGVSQQILAELQVELDNLKFSIQQHSIIEHQLKKILEPSNTSP